ncbi:MAG: type II secretion system protein [Minisyncoccia bacterium]
MLKNLKKKRKMSSGSGFGLVEVILGASIILLVVVSIVQSYNVYINYALSNQNNIEANFLLEEGVEAVVFLRDQGFASNIGSLTASTTYYLYFSGTTWQATSTIQYIDNAFLRGFALYSVSRDVNDDISVSGTNDPNTKKLTVSVSYPSGHSTTTKTLSTYITNIHDN